MFPDITYCTNIHAADGWEDVFNAICRIVPRVSSAVSRAIDREPSRIVSTGADNVLLPTEPFSLCPWLSALTIKQLDARRMDMFRDWCQCHHVEVSCINGFPYGAFHRSVVKHDVYIPDWTDPKRLQYTCSLADVLERWLAADRTGVISTLPLGFGSLDDFLYTSRDLIIRALEHLDGIAQRTAKHICLAFEPEPGCALETIHDVIVFADRLRLPSHLQPYFSICFDCCHQAVQFEHPRMAFGQLQRAGIKIGVIHLSNALSASGTMLHTLKQFNEPKYLHQTVGRTKDHQLLRFNDLEDVLQANVDGPHIQQWRVHFHVPVDQAIVENCATTQQDLLMALACLDLAIPLVVETYSLGVIPNLSWKDKEKQLVESIVRELLWVRRHIPKKFRL